MRWRRRRAPSTTRPRRCAAVCAGTPPGSKELWALVWKPLGQDDRPFPVRRAFEPTATERSALELLVDPSEEAECLDTIGLPTGPFHDFRVGEDNPGDLARLLGLAPPGPLDDEITIDGQPHPAWALISDALYQVRTREEVLDRLMQALAPERACELWTALALTFTHAPRSWLPPTLKEQREKNIPGKPLPREQAHRERFVAFLVDLNARLRTPGRALAEALADAQAAVKRPDPIDATVGVACLAQRDGALPPRDAGLLAAVSACADEPALRPVLDRLRAGMNKFPRPIPFPAQLQLLPWYAPLSPGALAPRGAWPSAVLSR